MWYPLQEHAAKRPGKVILQFCFEQPRRRINVDFQRKTNYFIIFDIEKLKCNLSFYSLQFTVYIDSPNSLAYIHFHLSTENSVSIKRSPLSLTK